MTTDAAIQKIERVLRPLGDKKRAAFLSGYLNTKYRLFGLSVPQQRAVAKAGFGFDPVLWNNIWQRAEYVETLSQCLLWFEYRAEPLSMKDWPMLQHWVRRIDNWAHSDSLSSLYAQLYELDPTTVYAQYKQWNRSKHPWEVRASLVGLFYYARSRQRLPGFGKALAMVRGAFSHQDVYVQKGIGWCLREMYNVYPEQTYAFLKESAAALAPAAWQAATEKLTRPQKQALLTLRKARKRL